MNQLAIGIGVGASFTPGKAGLPGIANDEKLWLEYRLWRAQHANKPYSMQKSVDGSFDLRFEVRQGDLWAFGGHRSELTGLPWSFLKAYKAKTKAQFLIESGPLLTDWCLLHQIHHDDSSVGDSPPFALELDTLDRLFFVTRNNAGTQSFSAFSAAISRNQWYTLEYEITLRGTTGDNTLYAIVKNNAGATVLSWAVSGANIGYDDADFNYMKMGCYLADQPQTFAIRWRNFSTAFNQAVPVPAEGNARMLPMPMFEGLNNPPTWCLAPGFHCLTAWKNYAYEHEVNLGRIDFIYDQSDNGWIGGNQAVVTDQPVDAMGRYILAPYFEGDGDFLNVVVDNDTSDLLDTAGFAIAVVMQPVGVPFNDGATGSGTVNNNPLIFGENSAARNFGIAIRDNGSLLGGPWDAQFFVKDSVGEKSVDVPASLYANRPNLILAEHTGTAIRIKVNGGAWSAPVACGPMVSTAGFPRFGHCGTSYQGDIAGIATWKTVFNASDLAALEARYAAMVTVAGYGRLPDGAVLDLDFVNNTAQDGATAASKLTTTRASLGWVDDIFGNWTQFANNVPRITDKGLLTEEARTNSLRNSSMQGAVPGTPGTVPTNWNLAANSSLSTQIVGIGTENGIDYIDWRIFGTSVGGSNNIYFEHPLQVAAANGQVWTSSVFVKQAGGSQANITFFNNFLIQHDAAGVQVGAITNNFTVSSSWKRAVFTGTLSNALTAFVRSALLITSVAGPVDFTLRIGWPQLELGDFASSPIRTTNAAVTRVADAVTRPVVQTGPLTLFAEFMVPAGIGAGAKAALQLDNGTNNERALIRVENTTGALADYVIAAAATSFSSVLVTPVVAGTIYKTALAIGAANDFVGAVNGVLGTPDVFGPIPAASTTLRFGREIAINGLYGYLRRAALWPTRLSNAQLQAMTQ